ncbi:MAG: prepilin-type N-terminal cleavage/methylation domain-containing protein [Deltaproteobacteria bacterium]|nr:prepilin-type N-terminal cleavage/methylation domain-containing protein [Deltaproteobacteria bacterium]
MRGDRGFTLLEVLVSVALLLIMTVSLAQIGWLMTRGRERIEKRAIALHSARTALEKIVNDTGMAFLVATQMVAGTATGTVAAVGAGAPGVSTRVTPTSFRGTDRGDQDELDFTTLAGRRYVANIAASDQREVGYRVVPDPEGGDSRQLVRREARFIDDDVRSGGEQFPMVDGVKVFGLEYYDAAKGEWDMEWDSTERAHQGKLPAAVRVTLRIADPLNAERELDFVTVARIGLAPGPVEW